MAEGDTYRLRIVLRRSAVHPACINNLYYRQEDPLILDTAGQDLVDAFQNDCETAYCDVFTSFIAIVQYQVAMAPLFLTEYIRDLPGTPGNMSGDPLPPRTSLCLSWRTADVSRRGRGRIYLPPASESANSAGAPLSGYMTSIDDLGSTLGPTIGDGITTSLWRQMIWSDADQEAKEVTSYFSTPAWRSQRDRDGILSA